MAHAELEGGAAQVVGPVVLAHLGHAVDVPLGALVKLERTELDDAVVLGFVGKMDAAVDGQAGNLAQLVVAVGADGAHAVRTEGHAFGILMVEFKELLFTL